MITLISKLKDYYNDRQRQLAFFSAHVDKMTSPIFLGGVSLHEQLEQEIAQQILRPLFMYLVSKNEVDLNSNLIINACVMSLDHTTAHDAMKRRRRQLPGPDHLVGHRGSSLKEIDHYSGPCHGLIVITQGFPQQPQAFAQKCLTISFAVGDLLSTAARTGESKGRKMLYELKGLSQQVMLLERRKMLLDARFWSILNRCWTKWAPHLKDPSRMTFWINCVGILAIKLLFSVVSLTPRAIFYPGSDGAPTRPSVDFLARNPKFESR